MSERGKVDPRSRSNNELCDLTCQYLKCTLSWHGALFQQRVFDNKNKVDVQACAPPWAHWAWRGPIWGRAHLTYRKRWGHVRVEYWVRKVAYLKYRGAEVFGMWVGIWRKYLFQARNKPNNIYCLVGSKNHLFKDAEDGA
jgi:hypothetical protein